MFVRVWTYGLCRRKVSRRPSFSAAAPTARPRSGRCASGSSNALSKDFARLFSAGEKLNCDLGVVERRIGRLLGEEHPCRAAFRRASVTRRVWARVRGLVQERIRAGIGGA